mmetsp:Transcript_12327/g.49431  ORF Transcript_12327/g.49431 Transcript_12327/m.49431 type:complete len:580 (-) Transcript_12327:231-1970(-)
MRTLLLARLLLQSLHNAKHILEEGRLLLDIGRQDGEEVLVFVYLSQGLPHGSADPVHLARPLPPCSASELRSDRHVIVSAAIVSSSPLLLPLLIPPLLLVEESELFVSEEVGRKHLPQSLLLSADKESPRHVRLAESRHEYRELLGVANLSDDRREVLFERSWLKVTEEIEVHAVPPHLLECLAIVAGTKLLPTGGEEESPGIDGLQVATRHLEHHSTAVWDHCHEAATILHLSRGSVVGMHLGSVERYLRELLPCGVDAAEAAAQRCEEQELVVHCKAVTLARALEAVDVEAAGVHVMSDNYLCGSAVVAVRRRGDIFAERDSGESSTLHWERQPLLQRTCEGTRRLFLERELHHTLVRHGQEHSRSIEIAVDPQCVAWQLHFIHEDEVVALALLREVHDAERMSDRGRAIGLLLESSAEYCDPLAAQESHLEQGCILQTCRRLDRSPESRGNVVAGSGRSLLLHVREEKESTVRASDENIASARECHCSGCCAPLLFLLGNVQNCCRHGRRGDEMSNWRQEYVSAVNDSDSGLVVTAEARAHISVPVELMLLHNSATESNSQLHRCLWVPLGSNDLP